MLDFNFNMQSYKIRLHKDRGGLSNEDRNNLNSDKWVKSRYLFEIYQKSRTWVRRIDAITREVN